MPKPLFLLPFLLSCSEEKPLETISDYEVPFVKEHPVQTYTYISNPEHNILTHRFFSFKTKDGSTRTQKCYINGQEQWIRTYKHTEIQECWLKNNGKTIHLKREPSRC